METFSRTLLVGLTLVAALPATGCLDAADDAATRVGTAAQASWIEPGQVISGAMAAMQVVKMFNTYQKYRELEVSTGEILDEVKLVQTKLDDLAASLATVPPSRGRRQAGRRHLRGRPLNPDRTKNPWLTAEVTKISSQVKQRQDAAGVMWTLTLGAGPTKLVVGTDCPYYSAGYATADVTTDAEGNITRIAGPGGDSFARIPK